MKAKDVKEALRRRHGCDTAAGQWVCVEEAFCGITSRGGGIDLLAIGAWQTAKAPGLPNTGRRGARYPLVAYEVKVSRADFRREVNGYTPGAGTKWTTRPVPPWPGKAFFALERSHYFMFATPKGLLKDDEIQRRERPQSGLWLPPEAGLIEVDSAGRCIVRTPAPSPRSPRQLDVGEIAELIRHAIDPNRERRVREENAHLRNQIEHLERLLAKEAA